MDSETAYNWTASDGAIPINVSVSKLTTIGQQKVQFQVGARYRAEEAKDGAEDVVAFFRVSLSIPK